MPPANLDRGGKILHHHMFATPHIAAIDLQQEGRTITTGLEADAIVKQTPVAAMGHVPDRIARLRAGEGLILGRKIAVAIDGVAEDDAPVEGERGFLQWRQQAVGKLGEGGQQLLRISAWDGAVALAEQRPLRDLAVADRLFEGLPDEAGDPLRLVDEAAVGGAAADRDGALHQRLARLDQPGAAVAGEIDPLRRAARALVEAFKRWEEGLDRAALLLRPAGDLRRRSRRGGDDCRDLIQRVIRRPRLVQHAAGV